MPDRKFSQPGKSLFGGLCMRLSSWAKPSPCFLVRSGVGLCSSPLGWGLHTGLAAIRSAAMEGVSEAKRRDVCHTDRPLCLQHVWVSSIKKSVGEEQNYYQRLSEPHSFCGVTPTNLYRSWWYYTFTASHTLWLCDTTLMLEMLPWAEMSFHTIEITHTLYMLLALSLWDLSTVLTIYLS